MYLTGHAVQRSCLEKIGVKRVLNISAQCKNYFARHYIYKHVPLLDTVDTVLPIEGNVWNVWFAFFMLVCGSRMTECLSFIHDAFFHKVVSIDIDHGRMNWLIG